MPKFKNSNATFWVIFKHCASVNKSHFAGFHQFLSNYSILPLYILVQARSKSSLKPSGITLCFQNCQIYKIIRFSKLLDFQSCQIFKVVRFSKLLDFQIVNCQIFKLLVQFQPFELFEPFEPFKPFKLFELFFLVSVQNCH